MSRKELHKDHVGPLPEAIKGPHTPEAGAKYATLKCPGGGPGHPFCELMPPTLFREHLFLVAVGKLSLWVASPGSESSPSTLARKSLTAWVQLTIGVRECSRNFLDFRGMKKFKNPPARLIPSELSAHQISPGGVIPQQRSRPVLELDARGFFFFLDPSRQRR